MLGLGATLASYTMALVVVYYVVLFIVAGARRKRPDATGPITRPFFVLMVPMHNEELVVDATLRGLSQLDYDGSFRILVIDDGSRDATPELLAGWVQREPRVRVLARRPDEGGRGKGDALNAGYRLVADALGASDPWLAGAAGSTLVVGVVDADGRLDSDCLREVAPCFDDPRVGGVQIGVRIINATSSLLARMQDMEFVAFSWLVQVARNHLGSVGLGGNGQFTRWTALGSLGRSPWSPRALTEDLDLGLRLAERGWRNYFCGTTFVSQQGLHQWRTYLRQRTRWIQGHYQCWSHLGAIWRSPNLSLVTKVDLSLYLTMVLTVMLVSSMLVVSLLAGYGVISVHDTFLVGVVPYADLHVVNFTLAVAPLLIFTLNYQLKAARPFPWYAYPAGALAFALYAYVGAVATLRAWWRLAIRRGGWVKTPRVNDTPSTSRRPATTQ